MKKVIVFSLALFMFIWVFSSIQPAYYFTSLSDADKARLQEREKVEFKQQQEYYKIQKDISKLDLDKLLKEYEKKFRHDWTDEKPSPYQIPKQYTPPNPYRLPEPGEDGDPIFLPLATYRQKLFLTSYKKNLP